MEFLSTKFVEQHVEENPRPLTELGEFVYSRTYSRWLEERGRREYWYESVKRAIEYNMALEYKHLRDNNLRPDLKRMRQEAQDIFKNVYEAKQFMSGRTLWLGNGNEKINKEYVLGNFNCAFLNIEEWDDLGELFYLLMVGTGVGFKSTKKMAKKMDKIRIDTTLRHSKYKPVAMSERLEDTKVVHLDNGYSKIYIGDSKEGWVQSLVEYFNILTKPEHEHIHTVTISYDSVRPEGEKLKTFGGHASGHAPLLEMFEGVDKVLKNQIDPSLDPIIADEEGYGQVRPIHILDIGNLIGANVVVGGVRRTAEIFLFDSDDYESMFAKYGINGFWTDEHVAHHERVGKRLHDLDIKPSWFDKVTDYTKWKFEQQVKTGELQQELDKVQASQDKVSLELSKEVSDDEMNTERATELLSKVEGYKEAIKDLELEIKEIDDAIVSKNPRGHLNHRRMSNNSIAFTSKPEKEFMDLVFEMMKLEGEPGFVNLEEASRRVAKELGVENPTQSYLDNIMAQIGLNPCVEVILFSKNVCNLTTVNIKAFVKKDNTLDLDGLIKAQRFSARMGLRMTLATLELPNWNKIQQRDRLLGNSLTGWKDAMGLLGYTQEQENELQSILRNTSKEEADRYSKQLRVNAPMFVTAVKPEGTLSQVAGGVSSGLHWAHSPYFYRRVRINAGDPLAQVAKELGWVIHAEVGTNGFMSEEDLAKPEQIAEARTWVITFPNESGAKVTKDDITIDEQFDNYFSFQDTYTDMNTSNTITVKPDEWEQAQKRVEEGWDNFVGVSFLSHDGGSYTLAPYEAITKEEHDKLKFTMKPFDAKLLRKYESSETEIDLDNMESCSSGVCPIR